MIKLKDIYQNILTEAIERDKLIKAIEDRRLITIYYDSPHGTENKGWRRIEPCCYGINNYDNSVLRAWQVHGVSDSYPPGKKGDPLTETPGWRMFRTDGIKSVNETGNDTFNTPRPKYNPNDKDMKIIYKAVVFGGQPSGTEEPTPETPITPTDNKSNTNPFDTPPLPNSAVSKEVPSETPTSTVPPADNSGDTNKPSWFTKFGNKFRDIVNFGKKDQNKI